MLKKLPLFPLLVLLTALLLFVYHRAIPLVYDTFFVLKTGELIATTGRLPTTEVFSWTAQGREWIVHQWLADTFFYLISRLGGFTGVSVTVSLSFALFFLLMVRLTRQVLQNDRATSFGLSLFASLTIVEFFVARTQIVSFLAFIGIILILLRFILQGKNALLWLIPIMYVWTNSHASFVIGLFLIGSYALICTRLPKDLLKAKSASRTLGLYALISLAITLLPPLGYQSYKLLFIFSRDITFLSQFVHEWAGLSSYPAQQYIYLAILLSVFLVAVTTSWQTRRWSVWLLALPLVIVALAGATAVRQIAYGITAAIVIWSLFLPWIRAGTRRWLATGLSAILAIASLFLGWQKYPLSLASWFFPYQDIAFFKNYQLQGRMYNDYALGGFLLYYLYPQYQVFIDGRADVYLSWEMRDVWPLVQTKHGSSPAFQTAVDALLNKYHFSYLVIPYESYDPLSLTASQLMADMLLDDPKWTLVYASDHLQILVARDGQNEQLVNQLGLTALTPYRLAPFRPGMEQVAVGDYRRLINLRDSGVAESGLGFAYLAGGDMAGAKTAFTRAGLLNPFLGTPYLGLGQIALRQGQPDQAIAELTVAIDKAPYLGQAYLLLAQSYQKLGRNREAISVLERGLGQSIDFLSRRDLVQLLNNLRRR